MMKYIPRLYLYLFSALCFVLPFTDLAEAIPNILLAIMGIVFFFVIKKDDFNRLKNPSFFVLLGLIIFTSIQTIILNRWEDFDMVSRILIIPALIILYLPLTNYKTPLYAFLAGAFTMVVVSSANISQTYLANGTFNFAGEDVNNIILGERPYLGFVCVIAFCLSFDLGMKLMKHNKKQSILFYTLAVVFLGYIFIISARISLISSALIIFFYLLNLKSKILKFSLLISVVILFLGVFVINKDLKKRFFITENSYTIEEMLKFEPRFYIWNCALSLSKERSWLGWGFVNGQDNLKLCFSKSDNFTSKEQQDYFVRSRFNTHNQFLNFFLSNGIVCSFLFLFFFLIVLFKNRKDHFILSLLISLFLFCLVENVLSRQMGAMLFGIIYAFTLNKTSVGQAK